MEIQQQDLTLIEQPSMIDLIKQNLNPNGNKFLVLNNEKLTLAEEIKILIRKLWN